MALPPYLTTMVCPERERTEEAMVIALSTKDFSTLAEESSVDERDDAGAVAT
jgi:hypothetical protein